MSFFIEPAETPLDSVTELMAKRSVFDDRYDAIRDLRELDQQSLIPSVQEAAHANGFFRVASLQGPLEALARVLDPEFLKEKKRFYAWLAKHPQHVTYDRRARGDVGSRARMTISDGKVVD